MNKLVITAAPTGAFGGKELTPYIPLTPSEISAEVDACAKAGASVAHIHARDDKGGSTLSSVVFSRIVKQIREKNSEIILNLSTAGDVPDDERMEAISLLKPEMASFDCGSMNWNNHHVFLNSPRFLERLGACMSTNNIKPEIEIFDTGMMGTALHYIRTGLVKSPAHFQFVLGVMGGMEATVKNLLVLYEMLPEGSTWGAFGIGKKSMDIMYASLALGATGLRVGMEDTIHYSKGKLATSNAELVDRAVRVAEELGREIANPKEARRILSLDPKPRL